MENPKPLPSSRASYWSGYYAGFSQEFAASAIDVLCDSGVTSVLDPWNGSGTTTLESASRGVASAGIDLNPVLGIVAKSRLLTSLTMKSIPALTEEVLARATDLSEPCAEHDGLLEWLSPRSASTFRALDRSVRQLLIEVNEGPPSTTTPDELVSQCSDLAAAFYVATFNVLRRRLAGFQTSNPTWLRKPGSLAGRARPSSDLIHDEMREELGRLFTQPGVDGGVVPPEIIAGDARAIPWADGHFDAVLASPPYLTRIDYVRATLPELCLLGASQDDVSDLKDNMLGTTKVRGFTSGSNDGMPSAVLSVLDQIRNHPTKASTSYYVKYFERYFEGMLASLKEIRRVCVTDSPGLFVVQDSFYKDIHIDLQQLLVEIAESCGWAADSRHDFPVPRTLAASNPRSRKYRTNHRATESVIRLRAA